MLNFHKTRHQNTIPAASLFVAFIISCFFTARLLQIPISSRHFGPTGFQQRVWLLRIPTSKNSIPLPILCPSNNNLRLARATARPGR
ncbi:hypothetical protein B0T18DRAFT_417371 [Schizothecium vesticola]|uniref:Uncharacterized protein n=1 Tax=Schizothecium vesticola TaxID=314040 RepID=A0AA40EIX8_9PEZI|nr:hypothetical protein B0T18DRAFT_417371 [Schizothecium vesticola]